MNQREICCEAADPMAETIPIGFSCCYPLACYFGRQGKQIRLDGRCQVTLRQLGLEFKRFI